MTYMLDTDTLVFVMRGLKSRQPARRARAVAMARRCADVVADGDQIAISAITVSELEYGAQKSGQYESEIIAVRKVVGPFRLLNYDAVQCAWHYGRVRHELASLGVQIGAQDTLIAAHALAIDATLVSNNLAHFGRVQGLRLENWAT